MKKVIALLTVSVLLLGISTANAANLLFQDTFDDLSNISAGALGTVATWSSVASPGGKDGNSLSIYWPADGRESWDHLSHNLGNTTIPTSGKVTVQWSSMQTGDPAQTWVQGICRDKTSYYGACVAGDNATPNKEGLYVMDKWVINPVGPEALDYSSDVWNTVAMVFDMDAAGDNLQVYVAEGLDAPTTADLLTTQTIDLDVWPIVTFQALRYGYSSVGTWTNYIDDLKVFEGDAVVPEPATAVMLLLGGLCAFALYRRR